METNMVLFNEIEIISKDKAVFVKFFVKTKKVYLRMAAEGQEVQKNLFIFDGITYKNKWYAYTISKDTKIKREISIEKRIKGKTKLKRLITYYKYAPNSINYFDNIIGSVDEITEK